MTNVVSLANNQEEGVWSRISTSTRSASFIICLPLQKSSNYFLPWRSYSNVCITIFPICSIKVRLLLEDDMYLRLWRSLIFLVAFSYFFLPKKIKYWTFCVRCCPQLSVRCRLQLPFSSQVFSSSALNIIRAPMSEMLMLGYTWRMPFGSPCSLLLWYCHIAPCLWSFHSPSVYLPSCRDTPPPLSENRRAI